MDVRPVIGIDPNSPKMMPVMPPAWMFFTTNSLFFGLEIPKNTFPNGAEHTVSGYRAGVWLMPISQLDFAIAVQKQI